jgi:hypothetical protein
MNRNGAAKVTLVLGGFLGEDVALERLTPLDRAACADSEALGRAFFRFHLGHLMLRCHHCQVATTPSSPASGMAARQHLWNPSGSFFRERTAFKQPSDLEKLSIIADGYFFFFGEMIMII